MVIIGRSLYSYLLVLAITLWRFGDFQRRQPPPRYPSGSQPRGRPSNPRQPGQRQPTSGGPSPQSGQPAPVRIDYRGTICQSLCACQESQAYCGQRRLRSVPDETWPQSLILINFDQNLLSSLEPNGFNKPQLQSVKTAIFTFNQLTTIEANAFQGLSGLIELKLSSNKISSIKLGAFDGLTNIDTIDLQSNKLKEIDERPFAKLFNLKKLKLDNNELKTIDVEFFDAVRSIQAFSLGDNPWQCDCNLLGLFLWASSGRQIQGNPSCSGPEKAEGRSMFGFSYKEVQGMCKESWEDDTTSAPDIPEEDVQVLEMMNETCSSHNATLPVEICFISENVYTNPGRQVCLHCVGTSNEDLLSKRNPLPRERGYVEETDAKINITWTLPEWVDDAPSNASRYKRHDNGTLCIKAIKVEDGGEYICTAELNNQTYTESVTVAVENLPLKVALGVVGVFVTLLCISVIMLMRWWGEEVKAEKKKKTSFQRAVIID